MSSVAVVIVGRNAKSFVRECLQSLRECGSNSHQLDVIYADNASEDGSVAMVEASFPEVSLVANDENLGFCKASNDAAAASNADYYFFINDDTIMLEGAIDYLVDFLENHSQVGIVASRLFYPDMTEQWSGRKFPTISNAILGRTTKLGKRFSQSKAVSRYLCKEELEGDSPFEVDWVSAAAMMVRRETFEKIGGFPEDYYYWHEPVFCRRAMQHGWKTFLHPLSRVIHHEGKGSGARPYRVKIFHIVNFHEGAYRCFCEWHDLHPLHPLRLFVYLSLKSRAGLLLLGNWLTHTFQQQSNEPQP